MKKYKVTEHPYLKKDLIIEPIKGGCDYGFMIYQLGKLQELLADKTHLEWLKNGWIEEIQEPEFTKDDMVGFAIQCYQKRNIEQGIINEERYLNEWIKEHKK